MATGNILPVTVKDTYFVHNDELAEISLFPLNVVLFPGMPLQLYIFEERYIGMIGSCLDRNMPFGVVLIKEGQEVGNPAEPYRVGTTARITKVVRLDEGRLNIMVRGEQRFELVNMTQRLPHLIGRIRYLGEGFEPDPGQIQIDVANGYVTFLRCIGALDGGWNSTANVPPDAENLSFSVASGIPLPLDIRQQLLETATARERLEQLCPLLQRANELLEEELVKRNPYQGPRLN
jgi:Lon protease-like protein